MKEFLFPLLLTAIGALILYKVIKSSIEYSERQKARRKNRQAQFSGSPVKEDKGFLKTILSFDHRNHAERIGAQGEYDVSSCLSDLDSEEYEVFNDLLLKDGRYTSQIDHLVISLYGVFVIETKNIHGYIYGNENSEFWKQYLPDTGFLRYGFTQEHEFRNPLRQNAGHIRCLRKIIFGKDIPIHGIVAFPNDSELKVTAGQPVLHMRRVVHYIKGYQDTVLTPEQVRFYRRRLLEVISLTESDREQHLENIHPELLPGTTRVVPGFLLFSEFLREGPESQ